MRLSLAALVLMVLTSAPGYAQSLTDKEAAIRAAVPYTSMLRDVPGLTIADYENAIETVARELLGQPKPADTVASPAPVAHAPYSYVARPYVAPVAPPPPRVARPGSGTWYDWAGTGTYMNYGTGEMCIGQGATRTCTGGR